MEKENPKIKAFIDNLKEGNSKKVKELWLMMNPVERCDAAKEFQDLEDDERGKISESMSVVEEKFLKMFSNYNPDDDTMPTSMDFIRNSPGEIPIAGGYPEFSEEDDDIEIEEGPGPGLPFQMPPMSPRYQCAMTTPSPA